MDSPPSSRNSLRDSRAMVASGPPHWVISQRPRTSILLRVGVRHPQHRPPTAPCSRSAISSAVGRSSSSAKAPPAMPATASLGVSMLFGAGGYTGADAENPKRRAARRTSLRPCRATVPRGVFRRALAPRILQKHHPRRQGEQTQNHPHGHILRRIDTATVIIARTTASNKPSYAGSAGLQQSPRPSSEPDRRGNPAVPAIRLQRGADPGLAVRPS